jgi:hypothetical protein
VPTLLTSLGLSLFLGPSTVASAVDEALSLTDLAAYRAALEAKPAEAPVAVGFRQLWEHPETYEGRRVEVTGRVVRRFRQGAFGTFPPLVEVWVVNRAGDPFCLVFPDRDGTDKPPLGTTVRFVGTFLRRIRYQGGDTARLAPLIVGPGPPVVAAPAAVTSPNRKGDESWIDWTVGLVAALVVALVLAHQHWRRPARRGSTIDEPIPQFEDGS